jgi:hypothetical protein
MPWSVPQQYALMLPTRTLLRRTYNEGRGGQYLIFIYRNISAPALGYGYRNRDRLADESKIAKTKDYLTRHCRNFVKYLRRTGQVHGKVSFIVLRATAKLELLPCFSGDIDLELSMSSSGLPQTQDSSAFHRHAKDCLQFTKLIGAHVVHALSRS